MYAANLVKLHWQPIMPRALFSEVCACNGVCKNEQSIVSFIYMTCHDCILQPWKLCPHLRGCRNTNADLLVGFHPAAENTLFLRNLKPQSHVWQKSLHSSKWFCVCYVDISAHTWGYSNINKTTWLTSSAALVVTGGKTHQLNTLHMLLLPGSARTPLCPHSPHADPHQAKGVTPALLQTRGQARQCLTSLGDSGSAGKAKQAGIELSYKARASLSALGLVNEAKGDFWK